MAKILIVEDDAILSMLMQKNLEIMGYDVLEAVSSGSDAIQSVVEKKPDLIIMDIAIIGSIDGIQTMIEIRKFSDIPVIYVSGNSDIKTKQKAEATPDSQFLSKPIMSDDLKERIDSALSKTQKL